MWHWINPNPRHSILLKESKTTLDKIRTTSEFKNYNSFADIDRTPFLYISELFLEKEKYTSKSCESFATFGWCSEREMAFNCLLDLMNFTSKVTTVGNHCWTEVLIEFKTNSNSKINFIAKIDNSFHQFSLTKIEPKNIFDWKSKLGNSAQEKWYNKKAHSTLEKKKILSFSPSKESFIRIENAINFYLSKQ